MEMIHLEEEPPQELKKHQFSSEIIAKIRKHASRRNGER
jgi:hypothetical protein